MDHDPAEVDDTALVAAVRAGSDDAFAELYRRHVGAAVAYARRILRSEDDATDVVSEAFARMLGLMRRGRGPSAEFRPYLVRTVRNLAFDRYRADRRVEPTDDPAVLEQVAPFRDLVVERDELAMVGTAFATLPPRWQEVLWRVCVEGMGVDSASQAMGTNPNALTSLAYRAREGLRVAYLQANLPTRPARRCAPHSRRLGALVRGTLGAAPGAALRSHLAGCGPCRDRLREVREINGTLREHSLAPSPTRGVRGDRAADRVA